MSALGPFPGVCSALSFSVLPLVDIVSRYPQVDATLMLPLSLLVFWKPRYIFTMLPSEPWKATSGSKCFEFSTFVLSPLVCMDQARPLILPLAHSITCGSG